jgi:hypothetical protein
MKSKNKEATEFLLIQVVVIFEKDPSEYLDAIDETIYHERSS